MRLIPPSISDEASESERQVFRALAASDGPRIAGWTVLHSLDIASHTRQVEGEIDFLCVVPGMGVLVLEVKGAHRLRREGGLWYFGADAKGDSRGPFKQASRGMHSVRDRVLKARPALRGVPFWSAVAFPFIDFSETSEEWHEWQVIDRRALAGRAARRPRGARARARAQPACRAQLVPSTEQRADGGAMRRDRRAPAP